MKLQLKGVSKAYGRTVVLDNLDIAISENEFFAVLGPSGSGKSTLLRIIIGVESPDSGRIFIDGRDVTDLPPNKRNVSVVFQSYALYPNMTVYENIAFPLKMRRLPKNRIREKVQSAADKLGISEILNKSVTKISGGQKQRTALARALVRDPAIFLLDEPLSNLDARIRFRAREELRKIQQELNQTFVYVTHDQSEIANLANSVAVLHNGKFEQIESYAELYSHPRTAWVGDFVGNYPMNFISANIFGFGDGAMKAGFRPEWTHFSPDGIRADILSTETIGDTHYLFCGIGEEHFIVKAARYYEPGTEVNVAVEKFNLYENGILVRRDVVPHATEQTRSGDSRIQQKQS
ncbi:MAG: ABC transporter ATP-binding protein [Thermoplasmata archaeon]|nr:ABC transporter ATP-binding protein [Candidatus Sysuiplasma jiujiangense]